MSSYHTSVLLQQVLDGLRIHKNGHYIDATLGAGGHSFAIAREGGIVLGIDQDKEAIEQVKNDTRFKNYDSKITVIYGNFNNIERLAQMDGFKAVDGIVFDLVVSSHQLDIGERGFSFIHSGPLDMRMDKKGKVTAADLVNGLHKGELIELFTKYGEEPFAKKIAEAIVNARFKKRVETTNELAYIVENNVPKIGKIHPATRIFQALRIAVNDEMRSLEEGMMQALTLLVSNGRMVVISFHSLEDRTVKHLFEKFENDGVGRIITSKPILPPPEEIQKNPRSRSAKMRIFEKSHSTDSTSSRYTNKRFN